MFDAREFINETRRDISGLRKQARWSNRASSLILVVGLVLFVTAAIQALLLGLWKHRGESAISFSLARKAAVMWQWFDTNVTMLWHFVASLPFPKSWPADDFLPWVCFSRFTC
jgi:hypothetical protein